MTTLRGSCDLHGCESALNGTHPAMAWSRCYRRLRPTPSGDCGMFDMDQDCPSRSALPLVLRDPIRMTSHGQYTAPLIDLHQNSARAMPTPAHRLGRLITAPATVISIRALRAHCSKCSIRELCLPVGLEPEALRQLDAVVTDRIGLKRGDT